MAANDRRLTLPSNGPPKATSIAIAHMSALPNSPRAELPIWKGRRGMVTAALCCVLALPCAFALWLFADRSAIAPSCATYGRVHGMAYIDFKTYSGRRDSNVGCLYKQSTGQETEVSFSEVAPFLTKIWVDLAVAHEFTIPVFAILLGLARAGIYLHGARSKGDAGT